MISFVYRRHEYPCNYFLLVVCQALSCGAAYLIMFEFRLEYVSRVNVRIMLEVYCNKQIFKALYLQCGCAKRGGVYMTGSCA